MQEIESAEVIAADEPIPYELVPADETIEAKLNRMEIRLAFIQGEVERANSTLDSITAAVQGALTQVEGLLSGGGGMFGKLLGL